MCINILFMSCRRTCVLDFSNYSLFTIYIYVRFLKFVNALNESFRVFHSFLHSQLNFLLYFNLCEDKGIIVLCRLVSLTL